jgi:hypothetical protein
MASLGALGALPFLPKLKPEPTDSIGDIGFIEIGKNKLDVDSIGIFSTNGTLLHRRVFDPSIVLEHGDILNIKYDVTVKFR